MVAALLDTIPFYAGVKFLHKYLQLNPENEFIEDKEIESSVLSA
jgi:hypothetical protein